MVDFEDKVACLRRPQTYPEGTEHVTTKQTHMSCIFLTDTRAWKLKKPYRFDAIDLTTVAARRQNCQEEVRLNRRLAPDLYEGVVPLTVGAGKVLQLHKPGIIEDWLVCMRRLPSERMLDCALAHQTFSEDDLGRVGNLLATFYLNASPVLLTTQQYTDRLTGELQSSHNELAKTESGVDGKLIQCAIRGALGFIAEHRDMLDERVRSGKIVEAHGDLRPEHICLQESPVIIDCLEFNRELRTMDPASELMFLYLECDRFGAADAGARILETYCDRTGDRPSDRLLEFYRHYHACVRAKVAIWHLRDQAHEGPKWSQRAEEYLKMAA